MLQAEIFIVMIEGEATAYDLDRSFNIRNVRQGNASNRSKRLIKYFFEGIRTGPNSYLNAS